MSRYCSNCGQLIRQGAVYCSQCGKVISEFDSNANPTFIHEKKRQLIHEDFKTIVCHEQTNRIELICKVLNVSVKSTDIEAIRISWGETGSWGLSIEHLDDCLQIREQNYLGFQNISDIFLPEKYKQVYVQIPKDYKGGITLCTDTGRIELIGVDTNGQIQVSSSAGWIDVEHVRTTESVFIKNSVGKISARELYAEQNLAISTTVGGIKAYGLGTGKRISLTAQTGSIDCTVADKRENFKTIRRTENGATPQTECYGNGAKLLETTSTLSSVNIVFEGHENKTAL